MKRFFSLFVVAFALCMPATMLRADQLGPLYDGTNTTGEYIPLEGNYADAFQRVQIIYPKADLASMAGKNITKMTFYIKTKAAAAWGATIEVALAETSDANFNDANTYKTADFTVVYSGTDLNGMGDVMEIPFSNEFIYSGEKNLLFELRITKGGAYKKTIFYAKGGYDDYQSLHKYSTTSYADITSGNRKYAIPKTLFTYEEAAVASCAKINTLESSAVTANSATLTWTSEAEKYQFVCVLKGAEPAWTANSQAVKTVTLDTLKSNTEYDFYVRSFCSDTEQGVAKKVSFKTDLACYEPTLLAVPEETVTSESAAFTWHASGKGETQYQYTYGLYGSDPDWSKATLTSELSATLTGLNAASPYQVWVRSYCSADDQSDAATEYFATACGAVALPFNEDFSNDIDCWTTKNLASYSGVNTEGEFAFAWAATPPYQTIITPEIIASEKEVSVTFQYKANRSNYPESFKVGYSTTTNDLATAFQWNEEVTTSLTSFETYFAVLPVGVKYVAIQCTSNDQYYLYIDDFSVAEYVAPTCFKPTGLTVSEVGSNSAKLAWTSEAAAWNYQLSADGENWGEAKAATANPFELTGLNANTLYYVRVQGNCGEEDLSEWSEAVSFRTECGALALPYEEGFEGTEENEMPACWERVSEDGFPAVYTDSYWDSRANTGTQSLRFYGWGISQMAVLPEMEKALGELTLSFYYTATDDTEAPTASVGYITDLADASTFVSVKELPAAETYTQEEVGFEGAPEGAKIAIRYAGGTYFGSLFVDDLEVKAISGEPTAIVNVQKGVQGTKVLENGVLYLIHKGTKYNVQGGVVK